MIGQLNSPSPGFEDVIRDHFKAKAGEILRTVLGWELEALRIADTEHREQLAKAVADLKAKFAELYPDCPALCNPGQLLIQCNYNEERLEVSMPRTATTTEPNASPCVASSVCVTLVRLRKRWRHKWYLEQPQTCA